MNDSAHSTTPSAYGPAVARCVYKQQPEDFRVDELLGFEPDGSGQHVCLQIEKTGENTTRVAAELARLAGVQQVAVGYCGRKDRMAVSTQWFSVDLAGREEPDWQTLQQHLPIRVLHHQRHTRKLRPGSHQGNHFRITLREVDGEPTAIETRLKAISLAGLPNYFGPQRFGRDNLLQAEQMLLQGRRIRQRRKRGMLISAARSWLFNQVLAARVEAANWNQLLAGECVQLDGSHSVFCAVDGDADLHRRLLAADVHPTGPLCGSGAPLAQDQALEFEQAVLAPRADWLNALKAAGVAAGRRSLRVMPQSMTWQWLAPDVLRLEFSLPAGAYATTLIGQLGSAHGDW